MLDRLAAPCRSLAQWIAQVAFALALAAPASALPNTVFDFSGTCTDPGCSMIGEFVSGQLTLTDFVPGVPLNFDNFVSFEYSGSSNMDPFEVLKSDLMYPPPFLAFPQLHGTLSSSGEILSGLMGFGYFSNADCSATGGSSSYCSFLAWSPSSGNHALREHWAFIDDDNFYNHQGLQDSGDMALFSVAGAAAIPEPTSSLVFALGFLVVAGSRSPFSQLR